MKTQEQLKNLTQAPNKTVRLSLAAARAIKWTKNEVDELISKVNVVSIDEFWKNEEKTLLLWELLWVDKSKLGGLTLKETIKELNITNYQTLDNTEYVWKTISLWWMKLT